MSKQDLHLQFKQETGEYAPVEPFMEDELDQLTVYIKWLEEKVLTLYNVS